MYTEFFGLSESPFSIAPNPHYFYLSERHREALAHLTYGLGETGGFVLLTGEVGTGKTTVSRCVLSQLPDNTQAAFILNPTLSSQELLATICDELKIRYRKTGATLKTLTDKIQQKLIKNHEAGLNTILIIDEAQHLKAEVLEQLRLLTNLETNTQKLLQVILIGQPELQQLLQRQDLRQLAQRITARYHLLPLTLGEVSHYVSHRLSIAGGQPTIFKPNAIKAIHQLSQGIPRLINLLCDRALLGAYGKNQPYVDAQLIKQAATEVLGDEYIKRLVTISDFFKLRSLRLFLMVIIVGLAGVVGFYFASSTKQTLLNPSALLHNTSADGALEKTVNIAQLQHDNASLSLAVKRLLATWLIDYTKEITEPCELATTYELTCYWFKGTIKELAKLQYPAILKFYDEAGNPFYGNLIGLTHNGYSIEFAHLTVNLSPEWLVNYWRGGALILWQPLKYNEQWVTALSVDSDLSLWQWLEQRLSEKQQRPTRSLQKPDQLLLSHLQQFQRARGLLVSNDFTVNQQTLMVLANQSSQGFPRFNLQSSVKELL